MGTLAHHLALVVSVAALGAAGLRIAALLTPIGLERVVAAAVLAAAAAVLQALLLGLAGLGGNVFALTLAALGTWAGVRARVAAPSPSTSALIVALARRLELGGGAVAGALAGLLAAWVAWLLRYPALGFDTLIYHLPEEVHWVRSGHPGAVTDVIDGLPVGSYPLVHEVLVAWSLALAGSLVPASLATPFVVVLAAAAGWLGLRACGVGRLVAAAAVAALLSFPALVAGQAQGWSTDPAAVAWLVSALALTACARRRPALVPVAILAAGLAAGTKTTALPLSVAVAFAALAIAGRSRRDMTRPLAIGAAAALVVGGLWPARNLVLHGSPLWPFFVLPWGDPKPVLVDLVDQSLLDRPAATLRRLGGVYLDRFPGGLGVLAAALIAPFVARRRAVVVAGAATALSLLLWTAAPFTGVSDLGGLDEGTGDTTRYLMPGIAVAILTVALAASRGRALRTVAVATLAVAALANLRAAFALGFPALPGPGTLLAGAAAGVALGVLLVGAARRLRGRQGRASPRPVPARPGRPAAGRRIAAGACAVLLVAGSLALCAHGYLARHADAGLFDAALARWFAGQTEFTETEGRTVAMTNNLNGALTGDRLQHSLVLVHSGEPCTRIRARLREGWVVVAERGFSRGVAEGPSRCLAGRPRAYADGAFSVYTAAPAPVESAAGWRAGPPRTRPASARSSARAASTSRPTSAATRKRAVP